MKTLILILIAVWVAAPANAGKNPAAAAIAVDAAAGRHPISPLIYGVAWATASDLAALNATVNRAGGDNFPTYNWQLNAYNPGLDWFFESTPYGSAVPGAQVDGLIADSQSAHAQAMVTVAMLGWMANLGPARAILPAFSTAKYGTQCETDPYLPAAGNGFGPGCTTFLAGNNPNDAYVPNSIANEQDWVRHLVSRWGGAANGGPRYYIMDNEPSNWELEHRDVHPVGLHATEARDDVIAYSAMVKSVDPAALVVAPEEWAWFALLFSGYDQQYIDTGHPWPLPDQTGQMHGMYYLPWLLTQWKAAGRPVDVVSVHFYPAGGERSDDVSVATQLLRNRSTRLLWDPNYVSEDWERTRIALIPSVQSWIRQYYVAGTPFAVTEYNWGAEASMNGATAQADILGIFGREGLYLATRWMTPDPSTPTFKAMQMYRNYDGQGGAFGDIGVSAANPDPDELAVFAAVRASDGALTVMAVNKVLSGATAVTLKLANFAAGAGAAVYQLTAANRIARLPNVAIKGAKKAKLKISLPAQSITLFVIPAAP